MTTEHTPTPTVPVLFCRQQNSTGTVPFTSTRFTRSLRTVPVLQLVRGLVLYFIKKYLLFVRRNTPYLYMHKKFPRVRTNPKKSFVQ